MKEMLCRRINIFFLCLWVLCVVHVSCKNAVDIDYFTDSGILRTKENEVCYSNLYQLYCNIKCGTQVGLCIDKYCYCVYAVKSRRKDVPQLIYLARPNGLIRGDDFKLNDIQDDKDDVSSEMDESLNFSFRPALRHHIAHFCPNLDIARECIRTCMKEGKPAFCGKDHVCYCGHKYHNRDETSNQNVADTYGEFRDLYAKYFGAQYDPEPVEKKAKEKREN